MSGCVFCKIVRGDEPGNVVYEDENLMAFMDIKPITSGHLLIITKKHFELFTELDDELIVQMFKAAKKIGLALKRSKLKCQGINYFLADGAEAGQEVFHAHLHIIPRYRRDGFGFRMPEGYGEEVGRNRIEKAAEKIRKALA